MPTTDFPLSPDLLGDVRVIVYRALAATGHLPSSDGPAAVTGSLERAAVAIARLAEQRAWALERRTAASGLGDVHVTREAGVSFITVHVPDWLLALGSDC